MERLKLNIHRFDISGPGVDFYTPRGMFDHRDWVEDYDGYKIAYVPTIEDEYLEYYYYTGYNHAHFMGWIINGTNYTTQQLRDLRVGEFQIYDMSSASPWVIEGVDSKIQIGNDDVEAVYFGVDKVEKIIYNGETIYEDKTI